jgi:homoserine kinase
VTTRAIVRVPASTSNVGAGFDCVGVAIDRWLEVSAAIEPDAQQSLRLERLGPAMESRPRSGAKQGRE